MQSNNAMPLQIPFGFCWCGCGQLTNLYKKHSPQRGHVKGMPAKYILGHNRRKSPVMYLVDPETQCWIWQRGGTADGYGTMHYNGVVIMATRYFYEKATGPIPDGYELDHLCRNPPCVNPDHLEAVTIAENIRRGLLAKLTKAEVEEIRRLAGRLMIKEIADMYSMAPTTISELLKGYHWGNSIDRQKARVPTPRYRVNRWALGYKSCRECGTTDIPHHCHGFCRKCSRRQRTLLEKSISLTIHRVSA